ncbi:MAG: hypothetical protein AAFN79_14280 [Pseudomonadota bacterium]
MSAVRASLVAAAALIAMSLWAYVANGFSSETTLIPLGFGLLILAYVPWVRSGSRWATALAALFAFTIFAALFTPLSSSIEKGEALPIIRVGLMHLATAYALFALTKAAVAAFRKA